MQNNNTRRARYTVHIAGEDTPRVILDYSAQSAQAYYERRGLNVLSVTAGDYRKQVQEGGGFVIDEHALAQAVITLGIKLPVKIRMHSRQGDTLGNHRLRAGYHDIMLKSYRTAEQASSTLWHELTHAMQAERDGGGDIHAWYGVNREQRLYPYSIRPIEVEAREMSERMKDIQLTKQAQR